jgi:4-hydroxy-tetrahydrodipicolinate reductase
MQTINIAVIGISGKMGKTLLSELKNHPEFNLVGGINKSLKMDIAIPIYPSIKELLKNITPDVIIDFSTPASLATIPANSQLPLVIGTTGYTKKDFALLKKLAKTRPIFYSANFSLGIAILRTIARQITAFLPSFQTEIIEAHHKNKKDKPSGTALKLLEDVKKNTPIHSIRAGNIIGEHEILFIGDNERLHIKHEALSRDIFAQGALMAAHFILNKQKGLYFMEDLLKEINTAAFQDVHV